MPITALAEWAQGKRTTIQAARARYDAKHADGGPEPAPIGRVTQPLARRVTAF